MTRAERPGDIHMLSGQPSRTMLRPAVTRAAHQLFDKPLILNDPVVVGLVPEASEQAILAAVEDHRAPAALEHRAMFALRSRFAEDRLASAAARGVRQYVMLGAGLETFPWRQPEFASDMQIFFSDHPATLSWTRDRFRDRGLATPSNLIFVPADLKERRLEQRLAEYGFETDAPSFFSILGVIPYLDVASIDSMLGFFASLPNESEAVFSFAVPDEELKGDDLDERRADVVLSEGMGETWLTRVGPADMIAWANRFEFGDVFHLTTDLAQQRYFAVREDRLRAPRREQLISVSR
jgi:methyltransferase (TIGR00027 family)